MKKLLIVDDEDAMRGLYRKRLKDTYEVFETGDPEQALALALQHKPDAILLDLKMPKYDGFELCQNFRSLSPTSDLPIFVITGQSGNYKEECKAMGVNGYFEKPIDFNQLRQTLAAALKARPAARAEAGMLRMRVALKLHRTESSGGQLTEVAETETVSPDGFSYVSTQDLGNGSSFDVYFAGRSERYIGRARLVEQASAGLEQRRYRFSFEGQVAEWIVQKT